MLYYNEARKAYPTLLLCLNEYILSVSRGLRTSSIALLLIHFRTRRQNLGAELQMNIIQFVLLRLSVNWEECYEVYFLSIPIKKKSGDWGGHLIAILRVVSGDPETFHSNSFTHFVNNVMLLHYVGISVPFQCMQGCSLC